MWRRIPAADVRRSTVARRAMAATSPASASASVSRRRSAGSRRSLGRTRRSSAAVTASDGPSPSRPPPQSGAAAQAHDGDRLMARVPAFAKAFAGNWRIVEMDNWDNAFLDLVEQAHLSFTGATDGEIAFGALKGFLDVRYGARDGS